MTADEFVKIVRAGADKLRVDDVVINTGNQEFRGKGMLQISRKSIQVKVTLDKGEISNVGKLPEVRTGIYTKKDRWKLTGVIEDSLQFRCDHVGPIFDRQYSWPGGKITWTERLHPIDLIPSGWDAMTRAEKAKVLKEHQKENPNSNSTSENVNHEGEQQDDFCFYATLFEYPVMGSSWSHEIKGQTQFFDYEFKKIEGTSDLYVSLRSKPEFNSFGEEKDWKRLYSFMSALAFVTGVNAWPYRIEYWRSGQKITDRVTSAYSLTKTIHAPFSDRLAFNAKTGSVKWNFQDALRVVTDFFDNESAFAEEIAYLHFLFRQSGAKDVHRDIQVLALCVLFENIVQQIFRELKLDSVAKAENPIFNQFEQAKVTLIEQMDKSKPNNDDGHQRLYQMVKSADPFNVKSMFKTIVNHFKLKWDGDMELIFETWRKARHPVVHRGDYARRSEDDLKDASMAESRIAGAINILSLKLFGYSGYMQHSAFEENGYRQI